MVMPAEVVVGRPGPWPGGRRPATAATGPGGKPAPRAQPFGRLGDGPSWASPRTVRPVCLPAV